MYMMEKFYEQDGAHERLVENTHRSERRTVTSRGEDLQKALHRNLNFWTSFDAFVHMDEYFHCLKTNAVVTKTLVSITVTFLRKSSVCVSMLRMSTGRNVLISS